MLSLWAGIIFSSLIFNILQDKSEMLKSALCLSRCWNLKHEIHKPEWRSQEFGKVPGNLQWECSDREGKREPAQVTLGWLPRGFLSSVSWIHSLLSSYYASVPRPALSLCLSLHVIIPFCILSTLLFLLHKYELHEHWACVCSVYSFIPSACLL